MKMSNRDDFEEWIALGIKKKWISDIVCDTHDGAPIEESELTELLEDFELCIPIVRVYGLERVDNED
jgi:hypothetical protein